MEDLSNQNKSLSINDVAAKVIHIEALLEVSLDVQATILAKLNGQEKSVIMDEIQEKVKKAGIEIYNELPDTNAE